MRASDIVRLTQAAAAAVPPDSQPKSGSTAQPGTDLLTYAPLIWNLDLSVARVYDSLEEEAAERRRLEDKEKGICTTCDRLPRATAAASVAAADQYSRVLHSASPSALPVSLPDRLILAN